MRAENVKGRWRLWLDDLPGGPGLAFSASGTANVLIPDPNFLESRGYLGFRREVADRHVPWPQRLTPVFWRGASTGSRWLLRVADWRDIPRFRLCLLVRPWRRPDLFDVGLSSLAQVWVAQEVADVAAAGILRPAVSQLQFGDHRHTIDVDGNSNSWAGLFTKLVLGTTVLKVDSAIGCRQRYYDRLIPWKNFVPVGQDMGELLELAEWLQAAPREAEAIAAAGQQLADELTFEAVTDSMVPRVRSALRQSPSAAG